MSKRQDIEDTYREWWVGKKCRLMGQDCEFRLVTDVKFTAPPSGIYGVTEFIFENGSKCFVGGVDSFRARKKDVDVEIEK